MLTLTPTEIIYHNGSTDVIVDELHFGLYLNEEIEFENVTLDRFFQLLIKNHAIFDIVFHRALGGFSILNFQSDLEIQSNEEYDLNDISGLFLQWAVDYFQNDITFYVDFHGRSEDGTANSMQFLPMSLYKHILLNIDTNFAIYGSSNEQYREILSAKKRMTLYDCINGLLDEISFYGTPEMRNSTSSELQEQIREIDENPERLTIVNLDEFLNRHTTHINLGDEESI